MREREKGKETKIGREREMISLCMDSSSLKMGVLHLSEFPTGGLGRNRHI